MIFRIHRNANYMTTSICHLRDTSLSWQAMGMLSFMLSCKEDFKFSIEGLTRCAANGNAATRSALKELRDKGYVVVTPIKEGGRVVEWNYDIYESPLDAENPHVEIPDVENPHVENRGQRNNIIEETPINNNILFNEEELSSIKPPIVPHKENRFVKPTLKEVAAYVAERKSDVNPQRFIDFYESKGWMVGSNHMKDWKAAVRTWEAKEVKQSKTIAYGNSDRCDGAASTAAPRQRDYSLR